MSLKDDLKTYRSRWAQVAELQRQEQRSASLELRWRQLNAAHGMARGLGLMRSDPSKRGVHERWARLKEKALDHQKPA